jgi:hypothetical protein
MFIYTHPVASSLPLKALVLKRLRTVIIIILLLYTHMHVNLFIAPLLMRRSDVSIDVSLVEDIQIMITFNVSNFDEYILIHTAV